MSGGATPRRTSPAVTGMSSRTATATPARPLMRHGQISERYPGRREEAVVSSARTSWSTRTSGALASSHPEMPLRAAARMPLTLTVAIRMISEDGLPR